MASLYEIMREQEDEKLARQLHAQNVLYAKEEEFFNSELSDEELAKRLQEQYGLNIEQHMPEKETKEFVQETDEELARRMQEEFDRADNSAEGDSAAQVDPAEFEDDETAALQYEEDERLAYEMQNVERSEVLNVHPRHFNAVEERYATLKPMHFDENGEEPDDDYYQELEDQDIAFVYRRFPEKLNAQSDEPKALHYQTYSTRNTGKGETRSKKKISKAGRELITQFRVKEEGFEYGVLLGHGHDQAYCYDGVIRKVHFYKKIRSTAFITAGKLVLVKLRSYQDQIADVVHIYKEEDVARLTEMGEIAQLDPVLYLPPEVLQIILNYVGEEITKLSLFNRAWNAMVKKMSNKPSTTGQDNALLTARVHRITWGNLSNFHARFLKGRVAGICRSTYFCPAFIMLPDQQHFSSCALTHQVLGAANELWADLQASRGNTAFTRHEGSDDDSDDDRPRLGFPLYQPRTPAVADEKPFFTKSSVLLLKYDDVECINYAATVLWTWWTIHKRKDLDQRPETIAVPIRATLLRMLRRGVDATVSGYEHTMARTEDKQDESYLAAKRELKEYRRHWDLVLNPPPYYKYGTEAKEAEFSDDDD